MKNQEGPKENKKCGDQWQSKQNGETRTGNTNVAELESRSDKSQRKIVGSWIRNLQ